MFKSVKRYGVENDVITGKFTLSSSHSENIQLFYAPSVSLQEYKSSYVSHSTYNVLKQSFYSGRSVTYTNQIKDGFYRCSVARVGQLSFLSAGDYILANSFKISDVDQNVTISDDGFGNLYDVEKPGMIIGNIFYHDKVFVIWEDQEEKYKNLLTGSNWRIDFNFGIDVFRLHVLCDINTGEFNYSQNPTSVRRYGYSFSGLDRYRNEKIFEFIYTGSDPNRNKYRNVSNTSSQLSPVGLPRAIDSFFPYGLSFNSALNLTDNSLTASSSAYKVNNFGISGSYNEMGLLFSARISIHHIETSSTNPPNVVFYHLFSYNNNTQSIAFGLSKSSVDGMYYGIISSKIDELYTSTTTCNLGPVVNDNLLVYYVTFNNNHVSHSIVSISSSSLVSESSAFSGLVNAGIDFHNTVSPYLYVSSITPSAQFSPYTSSISSCSISNVKLYSFDNYQHAPTFDDVVQSALEEFRSGSRFVPEDCMTTILTGSRIPFITTIGLYNEYNELLMLGKFSRPIQRNSNVPLTVELDLDIL